MFNEISFMLENDLDEEMYHDNMNLDHVNQELNSGNQELNSDNQELIEIRRLNKARRLITRHSFDIAFKTNALTEKQITKRTVLFLKEARKYDIKCYDYTHTCMKNKCNPRSVTDFTWKGDKITKLMCNEIGLNPDIYYCKMGLFHDCGYNCPGNTNSRTNCYSCLKTGASKGSIFSSFETENKTYFDIGQTSSIRVRDNSNDNYNRLLTESFKRDKILNSFTFEYLDRLKKDEEYDISLILNKNNRLKYSTRQILNKCNWLGNNTNEIVHLMNIFLLKEKCYKKRIDRIIQKRNNKFSKGTTPKRQTQQQQQRVQLPKKNNKGCYILSYEIFKYLNNLSRKQIAIQYGIVSISKMVSNSFKGIPNKKHKKRIMGIFNIVKVAESLFLNGLLPGIARLFNQVGNFFEYQKFHISKGIKYIDRCKRRCVNIDLNRYFFLTSFDSQKNCEKELNDCMASCKKFWKSVRGFSVMRTDLINFPTPEEIRSYICYILAIYTIVKTSGSFKGKRRTIDPSEIVIGSMYLLSTGYSLYKKYNSHDLYIPKIKLLSRPGYLPFESEFSFIIGIKQTLSSSHKDGLVCIKNAVEYHAITGWKANQMRNYILNFGNNP